MDDKDLIEELRSENRRLSNQLDTVKVLIDKRISDRLDLMNSKIDKLAELKEFFSTDDYLSKIDKILEGERESMREDFDRLRKSLIENSMNSFEQYLSKEFNLDKDLSNYINNKIKTLFSNFGDKEMGDFIEKIYSKKVVGMNALFLSSFIKEMNCMGASQRLVVSKATKIVEENQIADFSNSVLRLSHEEL